MSKLIALRFADPEGADQALARIQSAVGSDQLSLEDALTISWPEDARRPRTRRPFPLTLPGRGFKLAQTVATGLFYVFVTVSSTALAVAGHLLREGIAPEFVVKIRDQIAAGSSILILMTDERTSATIDELLADLAPQEIGNNDFTNIE